MLITLNQELLNISKAEALKVVYVPLNLMWIVHY